MTRPLLLKSGHTPISVIIPYAPDLTASELPRGIALLLDAARLEKPETDPQEIPTALEGIPVIIRCRPLTHDTALSKDLALAMRMKADAVLLPQVRHGADIQQLHAYLDVQEVEAGLELGKTTIIAISGDNGAGVLNGSSFAGKSERLKALVFDPLAFKADIGLNGKETLVEITARAMTVMAASAAGLSAIKFGDTSGSDDHYSARAIMAQRDGFDAVMAATLSQARIARDSLTSET